MKLIGMTQLIAIKMVESATHCPAVERSIRRDFIQRSYVPFTYSKTAIIVFVKHFGNSSLVRWHHCVVPGKSLRTVIQRSHVYRVVVASGEQSCSCGRTNSCGVKIGKSQSIIGQTVQHRSLHQSTESAGCSVSGIVNQPYHHIWSSLGSMFLFRPCLFRFGKGFTNFTFKIGSRSEE